MREKGCGSDGTGRRAVLRRDTTGPNGSRGAGTHPDPKSGGRGFVLATISFLLQLFFPTGTTKAFSKVDDHYHSAGRQVRRAGGRRAGRQTASGRRGGRGSQGTPGHRGGGPGTAAKGKFHNDLVSDLVSAMPAFRAGMKKLRNGRVRASFAVCRESARLGR